MGTAVAVAASVAIDDGSSEQRQLYRRRSTSGLLSRKIWLRADEVTPDDRPLRSSNAGWACVQTYSSQEKFAVENLLRQEYHAFCPLEGRPSKTNALLSVEVPIFPSYVFVRLAAGQPWQSIDSTRGVIRLLTDRNRINPRPLFALDSEVNRAVERLQESVSDPFPPGTTVRVRHGAFTSFVGEVQKMDKHMRLTVLLSIFGRDTTVEFTDPSAVEVIEEA